MGLVLVGENVGDVFVTLGVDASDFDDELRKTVRAGLREVEKSVNRSMQNVLNDVEDAAQDIAREITKGFDKGVDDALGDVGRLEREVRDSLSGVSQAFEEGFREGAEEALSEVKELRRDVDTQMDRLRDDFDDPLPAPDVSGASGAVGGLGGQFKNAFGEFANLKNVIIGAGIFKLVQTGARLATGAVRAFASASKFAAQQIGQAVNETTALNESINAVRVLLLDGADSFFEFSRDSANSLGIIRSELNQAIVPFASLLRQAGGGGQELSNQMQVLSTRAADVASVFNEDVNEVLRTFGAALRGETEPARRFGVNLSEFAIKAKAVELGMARVGDRLTSGQRAMGAYAAILEQTNFAQGDFALTAELLPNALRRLRATVTETQISLGEQFIGPFTTLANEAIPLIQGLEDELAEAGDILADAFSGPEVTKALDQVIQFVGDAAVAFARFAAPIVEKAIPAIGFLAEEIGDFLEDNADRIEALGTAIGAGFEFAVEVIDDFLDGLQSIADFGEGALSRLPLIGGLIASGFEKAAGGVATFDDEVDEVTQLLEGEFNNALSPELIRKLADSFEIDLSQGVQTSEAALRQLFRTSSEQELTEVAALLGLEFEELIPVLEEAGIAMGRNIPTATDLADAFNEQARSLQDVFDSQLALIDKNFAFAQSERDVAEAVKALNALQSSGAASADELAEAQQAVTEAIVKRDAVGAEFAETLTKEGTRLDEVAQSVLRSAEAAGVSETALGSLSNFLDNQFEGSLRGVLDLMNEGARIAGVEFSEFVGNVEDDLNALADEIITQGPSINQALVEVFGADRAALEEEFRKTGNAAGLALLNALEKILRDANPIINVPVQFGTSRRGGVTPFAEGGIVTSPTLALIGEAGPEAVVPLNRPSAAGSALASAGAITFGPGSIVVSGTATVEDGRRVGEGIMDAVERRRAELAVQGIT